MGEEEQQENVVTKILKILTEAKLTEKETLPIVIELLFSIGYSLEDYPEINSVEQIEIRYGENPTLGNALMAQSMWMRDTWVQEPEMKGKKKSNDRTKRNDNRRTKTSKATSVRDIQGNGRKTRSTKV